MFEATPPRAFETAPLTSLWGAMTPRAKTPPPDIPGLLADAEAQGFAAGQTVAEAALAPLRAQFERATAALDAACVLDQATLAPLFTDLVTRIAQAVVGGELRLSNDAVERLVREALALVEVDGMATVFVGMAGTPFEIDPNLQPGEIRVETPRHVVATSFDARLAELVATL